MEIHNVIVIPFIVGLVELLKQLGLPSKLGALVSVVIGGLIGVIYVHPGDVAKGILLGVSLGLAASGLYSGTRNTSQAVRTVFQSQHRKKNPRV